MFPALFQKYLSILVQEQNAHTRFHINFFKHAAIVKLSIWLREQVWCKDLRVAQRNSGSWLPKGWGNHSTQFPST